MYREFGPEHLRKVDNRRRDLTANQPLRECRHGALGAMTRKPQGLIGLGVNSRGDEGDHEQARPYSKYERGRSPSGLAR